MRLAKQIGVSWITASRMLRKIRIAMGHLIVDENLVSVGRRSASERIAMLLIHLYKRAERIGLVEADGLRLPLNQQHIADALGLSLVHTNKTLKRLQAAGLYTLKDGCLKLVNPAAMARMADYYALPLRPRPLI